MYSLIPLSGPGVDCWINGGCQVVAAGHIKDTKKNATDLRRLTRIEKDCKKTNATDSQKKGFIHSLGFAALLAKNYTNFTNWEIEADWENATDSQIKGLIPN